LADGSDVSEESDGPSGPSGGLAIGYLLGVFWRVSRWRVVLGLVLTVVQVGLVSSLPYLIGEFAQRLESPSGRGGGASGLLALIGGQFLAVPVVTAIASANANGLAWRFRRRFASRLVGEALSGGSIAKVEDARYAASYRNIHDSTREWDFGAGLLLVWQVLAAKLAGLVFLAVIARWYPWVAAGLLLGYLALGVRYSRWVESQHTGMLSRHAEQVSRIDYFRRVLIGPAGASDLRVFGLQGWFLTRYRETFDTTMREVWRSRGRGARGVLALVVCCLVLTGAGLYRLTSDLVSGAFGLSVMLLLAQAFVGVAALGPMGEMETAIGRVAAATRKLEQLPSAAPEVTVAVEGEGGDGSALGDADAAAELRRVGFRYPGAKHPIFEDFDLTLQPGKVYALVGRNGAGKSTMVKLLAGLYPAANGRIAVNGLDVADGPPSIGLILQDFARYPWTLRENIAVGSGGADGARIDDEILEKSGVAELIDSGSATLGTVLSPEYEGGTDLSGGEWQRVALARAMQAARNGGSGSGLVVLDEPAAALDVGAEAELFDHLRTLDERWTALFVSHRLSSVRRADEILVLDQDGAGICRLAERGTHEELLERSGLYAEMFEAQAAMFADAR
jgi:ATP-binding cassette subfamily B protein